MSTGTGTAGVISARRRTLARAQTFGLRNWLEI
jgi:hypothetical protein